MEQSSAAVPGYERTEEEIEIDLLGLLWAFLRNWHWIACAMILAGTLAGLFCRFVIPPSYRADASLCITNHDTMISLQDLQLNTALTKDYEHIIKSRHVLLEVIDNLGMELSYQELCNMVETRNPEDTHIVVIEVTAPVAEDAVTIANEILQVSNEEIYKVLGSNEPSILDKSSAEFARDVKPSVLKYALIGMLMGAMLVCGVITLRVMMDTTVKTGDDVTKWNGLPVIAEIPVYKHGAKKRKREESWPLELPFATAEAITQLRINVTDSGKDVRAIAVTSSDEHDGKSFCSFELAQSLAQIGKKTILVDCDMRKSVLRERMGMTEPMQGLSEYLSGNAGAEEIIYHTNIPNLDIIFSGKMVPNAAALLSSSMLGKLYKELRKEYVYVIADTPPADIVGDASLISAKCDGTIVVVESGDTDRRELESTKKKLEKVEANILGVVVNKIDVGKNSYYSHHYYKKYEY